MNVFQAAGNSKFAEISRSVSDSQAFTTHFPLSCSYFGIRVTERQTANAEWSKKLFFHHLDLSSTAGLVRLIPGGTSSASGSLSNKYRTLEKSERREFIREGPVIKGDLILHPSSDHKQPDKS